MKLSTTSLILLLGATLPFSGVASRGHRSVGGDDRRLHLDQSDVEKKYGEFKSKHTLYCNETLAELDEKLNNGDIDADEHDEKMLKACGDCDAKIKSIGDKLKSLESNIDEDYEDKCECTTFQDCEKSPMKNATNYDEKCEEVNDAMAHHDKNKHEILALANDVCASRVNITSVSNVDNEAAIKAYNEAMKKLTEANATHANECTDDDSSLKKLQAEQAALGADKKNATAEEANARTACGDAIIACGVCIKTNCDTLDVLEETEEATRKVLYEAEKALTEIEKHLLEVDLKVMAQSDKCDVELQDDIDAAKKLAIAKQEDCPNDCAPITRRNLRGH